MQSSLPNKRAIFAIVLASNVMIVPGISIVPTGLPKIHVEPGFTDAGLSWVSTACARAFGGCLLAHCQDLAAETGTFPIALTLIPALAFIVAKCPETDPVTATEAQ
jgi:hypothetical protein